MVFVTVPLIVGLSGLGLRYWRLLTILAMLMGIIPVEFLIMYVFCQVSRSWKIDYFMMSQLAIVNCLVILPWLLSILLGTGLRAIVDQYRVRL